MKRLPVVIAVAAPLLLTVGSGLLHGHMTNRWGPSRDMLAAARRLQKIPAQFGNWQLRDTEEMGEETVKMLQCAGYFVRTYENRETGERVKIAVLLGPCGPISVHTPEICFPSRNFTPQGERTAVTIKDGNRQPSSFWALTFEANRLEGGHIRVYYAWGADGTWQASENPRVEFASQSYLYKVQLSAGVPANAGSDQRDPCARFLDDFVPVARNCLTEAGP